MADRRRLRGSLAAAAWSAALAASAALPVDGPWAAGVAVSGRWVPVREAVRALIPSGERADVHLRLETRKLALHTAGRSRTETLEQIAYLLEARWERDGARWRLVPDAAAADSLRRAVDADRRAVARLVGEEARHWAASLPPPDRDEAEAAEAELAAARLRADRVPPDDPRWTAVHDARRFNGPEADAWRALIAAGPDGLGRFIEPRVLPNGRGDWLWVRYDPGAGAVAAARITPGRTDGRHGAASLIDGFAPEGRALNDWSRERGWRAVPTPWTPPDVSNPFLPAAAPIPASGVDPEDPAGEAWARAVREDRPFLAEDFRTTGLDFGAPFPPSPRSEPWWAVDRAGWRLTRAGGFVRWRTDEPDERLVAQLASGDARQVVEALAAAPPAVRTRIRRQGVRFPEHAPSDWTGVDLLASLGAPMRSAVLANTPIESRLWSAELWTRVRAAFIPAALRSGTPVVEDWKIALLEGRPHPDIFLVASARRVAGYRQTVGNATVFLEDAPTDPARDLRRETRLQIVVSVGRSPEDSVAWEAWLPAPAEPPAPEPDRPGEAPPRGHEGTGHGHSHGPHR